MEYEYKLRYSCSAGRTGSSSIPQLYWIVFGLTLVNITGTVRRAGLRRSTYLPATCRRARYEEFWDWR